MYITQTRIIPKQHMHVEKVGFCYYCFKSHEDLDLVGITFCNKYFSKEECDKDSWDEHGESFYYKCPTTGALAFIIGGFLDGIPNNYILKRMGNWKKLLPDNVILSK